MTALERFAAGDPGHGAAGLWWSDFDKLLARALEMAKGDERRQRTLRAKLARFAGANPAFARELRLDLDASKGPRGRPGKPRAAKLILVASVDSLMRARPDEFRSVDDACNHWSDTWRASNVMPELALSAKRLRSIYFAARSEPDVMRLLGLTVPENQVSRD